MHDNWKEIKINKNKTCFWGKFSTLIIHDKNLKLWIGAIVGGGSEFRELFGRSLGLFTNLFFLAMCQIRQHKDSIRELRSWELRMDEAWNNPPQAPQKKKNHNLLLNYFFDAIARWSELHHKKTQVHKSNTNPCNSREPGHTNRIN